MWIDNHNSADVYTYYSWGNWQSAFDPSHDTVFAGGQWTVNEVMPLWWWLFQGVLINLGHQGDGNWQCPDQEKNLSIPGSNPNRRLLRRFLYTIELGRTKTRLGHTPHHSRADVFQRGAQSVLILKRNQQHLLATAVFCKFSSDYTLFPVVLLFQGHNINKCDDHLLSRPPRRPWRQFIGNTVRGVLAPCTSWFVEYARACET